MKCPRCDFVSNDSEDLKEHYIDFHKVDQDYQFFINLFKRQSNVFRPKKCLRRDEFLLNHHFKVNHNFLVHYDAGMDVFEEKPVSYTRLGEIQKYEITFVQYLLDYDFYNSQKLVDDFLLNVKSRIRRSAESEFIIKCGFSLKNVQPAPFENEVLMVNFRYWSTGAYQTKSFNDYNYFNLREGMLKRVINKGMTDSSCHFNRFLFVNVKFWTLIVRSLGKMTDFIIFEADDVDDVNDDFIDECEPQTVNDNEFINDETQIDDNVEDYYAFTNVCRSVEDAMQDSFLEWDSSESQPNDMSNYCNDNYDPNFEQMSKFRDSAK